MVEDESAREVAEDVTDLGSLSRRVLVSGTPSRRHRWTPGKGDLPGATANLLHSGRCRGHHVAIPRKMRQLAMFS